jgi:hypothetical protein
MTRAGLPSSAKSNRWSEKGKAASQRPSGLKSALQTISLPSARMRRLGARHSASTASLRPSAVSATSRLFRAYARAAAG